MSAILIIILIHTVQPFTPKELRQLLIVYFMTIKLTTHPLMGLYMLMELILQLLQIVRLQKMLKVMPYINDGASNTVTNCLFYNNVGDYDIKEGCRFSISYSKKLLL